MRISRLRTLIRLGIKNLITVAIYRLGLKSGLIKKLMPRGAVSSSLPFFSSSVRSAAQDVPSSRKLNQAEDLLDGRLQYFSHHRHVIGSPPDWFLNPFTEQSLPHPETHWTQLKDFDAHIGDIKCLWEASRSEWAVTLAKVFRLTGEERYVVLLNDWIADWREKNPLNVGPNWKCGQETAIRMMQILLSAYLLGQHRTSTSGLQRFVREHCTRIVPTLRYAIAQNNNHGLSEAAALYVGGAWLYSHAQADKTENRRALRWHRLGARWLENRASRLIAPDGSFSQYSLNYHRMVVDLLNMIEFWRRELELPELSPCFYERARAAVNWLFQMVDPVTGEGPNLGANDGTLLFKLSSAAYRDYRPSIQLGTALFWGKRCYQQKGIWDEPSVWLGLSPTPVETESTHRRDSCIMWNGGYVLMNFPTSWGMIRFPNFRFRPSHADALHLDLWHAGRNILRDAGTYSYHADTCWQEYFPETQAHNTVEFDRCDQMPRISRFLFGAWLKMEWIDELVFENGWQTWSGSYVDYRGCRHKRTVSSNGTRWHIADDISGFRTCAVLRWRLLPGEWIVTGNTCAGDAAEFHISASVPITRCELVEGWESLYYMEKTPLPVLEVEIEPDRAVLTTEICLKTSK